MALNILFRVAKNDDHENLLEFLREHYYKEEPITISHPIKGHTKDDEEFTMSHIDHGTVLLAIDSKNDKIIGAFVAGPIEVGDVEKMLEESEKSEKKWGEIMKFLAYIESKANVLEKFKVEKSLHCHVLAVHHDYRGNKIGQKLFENSFINAKKLGYKILSADCTSIFSIKISQQLGMECVSIVTYEEYNKIIGKDLFISHSPNNEIKTFVKQL